MLYCLENEDLFMVEGGINGWYIVGGTLVTLGGVLECATGAGAVSGVLECATGAGAVSGVPTAAGGVGMIIYGATH